MTQILQIISNKKFTMLKEIDHMVDIDKRGKLKYFYVPNMEIRGINNFIFRLQPETIYIIIPVISMFAKDNDPHIILSKQILVTNNSSSKVIHDYLNSKLDQAIIDFGLTNLEDENRFQFIFKYKKVTLDLLKLPK
jgi:hypothetical protein